jgi:tape measure domain-containing protein
VTVNTKVIISAEDRTKAAFNSVNKSVKTLSSSFSALKGLALTAIGTVGITRAAKAFFTAADTAKLLANRLKLVTKDSTDLEETWNALLRVSNENFASFEDTVNLYALLARNTKELGINSQGLIHDVDTLQKAIALSGGSAQGANAAMIQFSQGMASGVLRGEELNSVMEQTPVVAEAIAKGLGVNIGQLRKMGKEGQLTGKLVFQALMNAGMGIRQEFEKMEPTAAQAMRVLKNEAFDASSQIDEMGGITSRVAEGALAFAGVIRKWKAPTSATKDELKRINEIIIAGVKPVDDITKMYLKLRNITKALGFRRLAVSIDKDVEKGFMFLAENVVMLQKGLESLGSFMGNFGDDILSAAGKSGARIKGMTDAFAKGKTVQEGLINATMNMILSNEKVQEALGKVFDAVFALVDPLVESLIPVFEVLAEIMKELKPLFELMMPTIKAAAEVIKAVLKPIKEIAKILAKLGDELNNIAKKFDVGSIGGGRGGLLGGKIIPGILQHGGPALANRPYIVGEAGPELFIPNQSGRVVSNNDSFGPVTVNIYDGTGRRISEYDSAIRVEIENRANRHNQFAALAA